MLRLEPANVHFALLIMLSTDTTSPPSLCHNTLHLINIPLLENPVISLCAPWVSHKVIPMAAPIRRCLFLTLLRPRLVP